MAPSRRIGLTGGIATGKSSVARCLQNRHGIPVLDADRFAREALAPGTEATRAVLNRYGAAVATTDPQTGRIGLDRPALGRLVFADARERRWLERLVHPHVRDHFTAGLAELREEPVVVLMIPLLFEAGLEPLCREIWLVDCGSEDEQLRRLLARDPLTEAEARARLRAQWPMAEKRARADVVLDNSGPESALVAQVDAALARPWTPKASAVNSPPAAPPTAPGAPPAA